MTVIFSNPGIADPRALLTLGVNVKETDHAIGQFGTGFKYALAVLMREGAQVVVHMGSKIVKVHTVRENIRGKNFDMLYWGDQSMHITTHMGKNWELWQAYRELYCNAMDEGGDAYVRSDGLVLLDDSTHVIVEHDEFEKLHHARSEFIITMDERRNAPHVLHRHDYGVVRVWPNHPHPGLFCNGIRVTPSDFASLHRYDVDPEYIELSEDRVASSTFGFVYNFPNMLMDYTASTRNVDLLDALIERPAQDITTFEDGFYWEHAAGGDWSHRQFVSQHLDARERTGLMRIRRRVLAMIDKIHANKGSLSNRLKRFEPTRVEQSMIDEGIRVCREHMRLDAVAPIVCVETLGNQNTVAMALKNEIVLTRACFDRGKKFVVGTMIEEFTHLEHHLHDKSREMQNFLLNRVVSLIEELEGEAL